MSEKVSVLKETTFQLATSRREDGTVGRMHIEVNRYKRVRLSGQAGESWNAVEFPLREFYQLLQDIKAMSQSKEADYFTVEATKKNKESGKQAVYAELGWGRDEDGVVYLTLGAPGSETMRYNFLPTFQYRYKHNGQPMPQNELSRRNAMAWCNVVERAVIQELSPGITPNFGGGNGGGNGNGYQKKQWNGNGNGNGYQKKQWNGNGNGNYPKKQWKGKGSYNGGGYNGGGNGGNNYNNGGNSQPPAADGNFDEYLNIDM